LGEFNLEQLHVLVHPLDAESRGIASHDHVRVHNDLGEVVCRATVSDAVRPGVVSLPKGSWRKASLNGMAATALCPAHVNEVAGGACYNDAWVEVEKYP
jgi:trimethylamine-N-oxide reductase (cytochrome c)